MAKAFKKLVQKVFIKDVHKIKANTLIYMKKLVIL